MSKIRPSQMEIPSVNDMDRLLGGAGLSVEELAGAVNGYENVDMFTDQGTLVLNIEPGRFYHVKDEVVNSVEVASVETSLRESIVRFTTCNRQIPIHYYEGCKVCGDVPSEGTLEASREYLLRIIDGVICFFELRAVAVASIRPYECTYKGLGSEYVKLYGGSVSDITAMTVDGVSVEPTLYRAFDDTAEHTVKITFADPRHLPEGAFAGCTTLLSINIPEGVSELPSSFCYGCSSISVESRSVFHIVYREYATEYYNVQSLGPCSFYSIRLPKTLKSIGDHAFDGAVKQYSSPVPVEIPSGLLYIGDYAFNNCNLKEIVMDGTSLLRGVGDSAFVGCAIEMFLMPFYLERVGNFAFYNNTVTAVGISRRLCRLGSYAFYGNKLSGSYPMIFPPTLRFTSDYSGESAFATSRLSSSGQGFSVYWLSSDAVPARLFSGATNLIELRQAKTSVGYRAFSGCSRLTLVELYEGCLSIGNQAFEYCTSLTSLVMPMSLREIGEKAFSGCSFLEEVTHVYGLSEELRAYGDDDVAEITWPNAPMVTPALMAIGKKAFEGCNALYNMLSESRCLQYIGEDAFLYHAEGFRFYSATPHGEVDDHAGGSFDTTTGNYQYLLFIWNVQQ